MEGLVEQAAELSKSGKLQIVGIWSHFARADEPNHSFNQEQLNNFRARVTEAKALGISPQLLHLSNSAASLSNSSAHFDLVRLELRCMGFRQI